jgi:hypothetical protein
MADYLLTEEATKNALVMPFINSLGYNVFDPTEVMPEFTSDVGTKKGEKVDYALMKEGKPIMLFECKKLGENLDRHSSQLYRYFSVTEARIGILTDGIHYRFFSDLEEDNKMDEKPFLEFNLLDFTEVRVAEVKKFSRSLFDLEKIFSAASELEYAKAIRLFLEEQWEDPSEDFVRFFASQVYSGRFTQSVREKFRGIVHRVLHQYLSDKINRRLKTALEGERKTDTPEQSETEDPESEDDGIITTEDEIEGYHIIKAIVRSVVTGDRVNIKDTKSYCNVVLDNSSRKIICRMRFNSSNKYIGIFDEDRNEEKISIDTLDDIHHHAERLKATVEHLLTDS